MKPSFIAANSICPSCESQHISFFYKVMGVPIQSVLLLKTKGDALSFSKGNLDLAFCHNCGFIYNAAFDPKLLEYSSRYEATQAFSPTFNIYQRKIATKLIKRHNLIDKAIVEIGCGQGEFLSLLCNLGRNRGYGFDPVFDADRSAYRSDRLTFFKDFYSEKYSYIDSDLICCKMTLEHIQETAKFIRMVRQAIGNRKETIVFFQVPDVMRILNEAAFWDFYFEHCSYFSPGSLARLFRSAGFEILDLERSYQNQYLLLTAIPKDSIAKPHIIEEDPESLYQLVKLFSQSCNHSLDKWRDTLRRLIDDHKKIVVWGASSKTVAFLSTLQIRDEILYTVDINPNKHGTFIAGTGQKIVDPEFLIEYQPDVVLVMNPVYLEEIRRSLSSLAIKSSLMTV